MIVIKPVLVLCFVALLVWAIRNRARVGMRAGIKVAGVLLTGFAVAAVVDPGLTQDMADTVGVTRGADLLLYALVVVFAFTTAAGYFRYRELENRLVEVVRVQAINDAVHADGVPGAEKSRVIDEFAEPKLPPKGRPRHASPTGVRRVSNDARRVLGRRWVRVLLLTVAFMAVAAPLVSFEVHRNPGLSPYDETPYLDYLYRVDHGQFIVGKGEKITVYSARLQACRGVTDVVPKDPAVCSGAEPPASRPLNTADIDPPTYYVLTALGAKAIRATGVTNDLLTSGRLMGVVWAGLGLTFLFLFARRLGATWPAAAIIAGLVLCTPEYLRMWTFVTPHAMELVVAIPVLWMAVKWIEGGGRWWHLALVGLLPPAVKATDVLVGALAVLMLLFAAYRSWAAGRSYGRTIRQPATSPTPRLLAGATILGGSTLTGSLVWLAVRSHYSLMAGNEFPQFNVTHFSLSYLTSTIALFMQPQAVLIDGQAMLAVLLMFALFGSVLLTLRSSEQRAGLHALSGAVLGGGIFGAWLFVGFNYVALHQFVTGLPIRYGLSVFSGAAAVLASSIRSRLTLIAAACFAVILLTVDLFPAHWP